MKPGSSIWNVLDVVTTGARGFAVVCEADPASAPPVGSVGVISDGDIRRALADRTGFGALTAASIMTASPMAITTDALMFDALRLMEENRFTFLVCEMEAVCRVSFTCMRSWRVISASGARRPPALTNELIVLSFLVLFLPGESVLAKEPDEVDRLHEERRKTAIAHDIGNDPPAKGKSILGPSIRSMGARAWSSTSASENTPR